MVIFGGFHLCKPLLLVKVEIVFRRLNVFDVGLMPDVIVFIRSLLVKVMVSTSEHIGLSLLFASWINSLYINDVVYEWSIEHLTEILRNWLIVQMSQFYNQIRQFM
jgi:hypothetical protein